MYIEIKIIDGEETEVGVKEKNVNSVMIIVVSVLSFSRYCFTTDQLVYRRATQTNETNIVNETKNG